MQQIFTYLLKGVKRIRIMAFKPIDFIFTYFILYANNVQFSTFKSNGIPRINVGLGGTMQVGKNFRLNNREMSNPIGRFHRCSLIVGPKGQLIIGENVGMSATAIVCHERIEIGDNVNLGGGVVIYDTDFHSLNAEDRMNSQKDRENTKTKPVKIGNNAFIGAHTTILKGVTIGENAIVGACSVVTKDISANEIWAGNPVKFIKKSN